MNTWKQKYAEKLKDPRWQRKRLEVLSRDNYRCQCCGDDKTELHIHHFRYTGENPWDAEDSDLSTTCKHCHAAVEDVKRVFGDGFAILGFNKLEFEFPVGSVFQVCIVGVSDKGVGFVVSYDYCDGRVEMGVCIPVSDLEHLISLSKTPIPFG